MRGTHKINGIDMPIKGICRLLYRTVVPPIKIEDILAIQIGKITIMLQFAAQQKENNPLLLSATSCPPHLKSGHVTPRVHGLVQLVQLPRQAVCHFDSVDPHSPQRLKYIQLSDAHFNSRLEFLAKLYCHPK